MTAAFSPQPMVVLSIPSSMMQIDDLSSHSQQQQHLVPPSSSALHRSGASGGGPSPIVVLPSGNTDGSSITTTMFVNPSFSPQPSSVTTQNSIGSLGGFSTYTLPDGSTSSSSSPQLFQVMPGNRELCTNGSSSNGGGVYLLPQQQQQQQSQRIVVTSQQQGQSQFQQQQQQPQANTSTFPLLSFLPQAPTTNLHLNGNTGNNNNNIGSMKGVSVGGGTMTMDPPSCRITIGHNINNNNTMLNVSNGGAGSYTTTGGPGLTSMANSACSTPINMSSPFLQQRNAIDDHHQQQQHNANTGLVTMTTLFHDCHGNLIGQQQQQTPANNLSQQQQHQQQQQPQTPQVPSLEFGSSFYLDTTSGNMMSCPPTSHHSGAMNMSMSGMSHFRLQPSTVGSLAQSMQGFPAGLNPSFLQQPHVHAILRKSEDRRADGHFMSRLPRPGPFGGGGSLAAVRPLGFDSTPSVTVGAAAPPAPAAPTVVSVPQPLSVSIGSVHTTTSVGTTQQLPTSAVFVQAPQQQQLQAKPAVLSTQQQQPTFSMLPVIAPSQPPTQQPQPIVLSIPLPPPPPPPSYSNTTQTFDVVTSLPGGGTLLSTHPSGANHAAALRRGNSAVGPRVPKEDKPVKKKNIICHHYFSGVCNRRKCRFLHHLPEGMDLETAMKLAAAVQQQQQQGGDAAGNKKGGAAESGDDYDDDDDDPCIEAMLQLQLQQQPPTPVA